MMFCQNAVENKQRYVFILRLFLHTSYIFDLHEKVLICVVTSVWPCIRLSVMTILMQKFSVHRKQGHYQTLDSGCTY